MTNAEARKLATSFLNEPVLITKDLGRQYGSFSIDDVAALARWALSRLGQEDVMDQEVVWHCLECKQTVPNERVTYEEYHDGCGGKVRAVTPAVTLPTRDQIMADLFGKKLHTGMGHVVQINRESAAYIADAVLSLYRAV